MKKLAFLIIPIICLIIFSCNSDNSKTNKTNVVKEQNNSYLEQYAGGYSIQVKGYSSATEMKAYALHESGSAKWMYIVSDGAGGALVQSEKTGKWTATADKIKIEIQGDTGLITEEYALQNGVFINTEMSDRYLKPSQ